MEEMRWTRFLGRSMELQYPLWACHSPINHLDVFMCLEALRTPSFRVLMEALVYRHDWLNHWPVWLSSISSPSSLPGGRKGVELKGWNWKFKLSNQRTGSSGNQPPSSKSYLFNINSGLVERGSSHPYYSENFKSFRNSMPGTGGKNQLYVLHIMSQFLSYFLVEVHSFYFYFRFVILLELVFTYGMRYESRFIYLHTDTPLFQQHLLKRLALFLWIALAPLLKINGLHMCQSIFGLCILFHRWLCLSLSKYHTVLIIIAVKTSIKFFVFEK